MSETFQHAGDSVVSSFKITSSTGAVLNISELVYGVDLTFSIFENFGSCRIEVIDGVGLYASLPIIGFESITFSIKTPGFNEKDVTMFVYKISAKTEITPKTYAYTLDCISYEAIKDRTTFSKSYSGNVHDIVKTVYKDHLNAGKFFEAEHTNNATTFISPYWSPSQSINWLAARAKSKTGNSSSYLFWEDLNGFHFYSLETLFSKGTRAKYNSSPAGININGMLSIKDKMKRIISFRVLESNSSLDSMINGTFASRLFVKNINENSFIKKEFRASDLELNRKKLNQISSFPPTDAFGGNNTSPSITKFVGSSVDSFKNISDTNAFETWVLERNFWTDIINTKRLEIMVHGHFDMNPGDIIEASFPAGGIQNNQDKFLSGRYLVSNIKHTIRRDKPHYMVLEIMKESEL